eukprot:SAG25_NODE_293_length_10288_cov_2.565904_9_plen_121_part_00
MLSLTNWLPPPRSHEIGLIGKQVSGWCQMLTANTLLDSNVMFNVPRAAINFNDGYGGERASVIQPSTHMFLLLLDLCWPTCIKLNEFSLRACVRAGGSVVRFNLLFSTVRETSDHGPFNR